MKKKETYENILHIFFSGYIDLLPEQLKDKTLLHGSSNWLIYTFRYVFVYFKLLLNSFLKKSLPFQNKNKLTGKIWIFADTSNQYQALLFLEKKLQNTAWVSRKLFIPAVSFIHLLGISRLFYLFQFPAILRMLHPKDKQTTGKIFEATGQFSFFQNLLKKYHPKMVILSNDHSITPRSLLLAAKSLSIPTVYIQHASISSFFPNLEASLNLLEGQHALDSYKKCGSINGKVAFIGMPKFEQYQHLQNNNSHVTNIGFAFNPSDNKERIETIINHVIPAFPNISFTFRKHPREERVFKFQNFKNIKESFPQQENVFDFLTQQDMIIAGDSSIHLEATLLNIVSVYYDFAAIKEKEDYYDFVKNKMISQVKTINQVKTIISKYKKKKPNVVKKAAYYNSLIDSTDNKPPTVLAVENILKLIPKNP